MIDLKAYRHLVSSLLGIFETNSHVLYEFVYLLLKLELTYRWQL